MTRRRASEALVRRWWSGELGPAGRLLSVAALPLSAAWRMGTALRGALLDRGVLARHSAPVPVVSVGNLAVGGTGKTPLAAWVARVLAEGGRSPALVTRGYGEDELLLHRRWNPGVPVHAHPDRVRAALEAAVAGADALVLDDGFQHRRLERDLDVVLLAAEHDFPGPVLPRGRYREPPAALTRADVVVVTRRTADPGRAGEVAAAAARHAPGALAARVRLTPSGWTDLSGAPCPPPEGPLLAVSAVAGPEAFRALVERTTGAEVDALAFPDHHPFDAADAAEVRRTAGGRGVVVTEKDAVKLERLPGSLGDVRVLTLAVEVEEGEDALRRRILEAAAGGSGVVGARGNGEGEGR